MSNKNYYDILGVTESADEQTIKKAYRDLAKKYHPDKHRGDKAAEEKFKDISEAYGVLSDPQKKAQYDQMRRFGGNYTGNFQNFNFDDISSMFGGAKRGRRASGVGGLGDLFSEFFSGRQESAYDAPGEAVTAEMTIPFDTAISGGSRMMFVDGKQISVKIPPLVDDGKKIRLRGQGRRGFGREDGDLIITVHVSPHPIFKRVDLDIYSTATTSFITAALGGKVRVQTYSGGEVELKIPAGTQPGKKFKLKGMGLRQEGRQGDHFVEIVVTVPEHISAKAKSLLQQLAEELNA